MSVATILGLVAVGLLAGMLAASLGLGGGVVFVPALVVLFSFSQHDAQGTSLAVILPTALIGVVGHGVARRIDWPVAARLAVGGLVGGVAGSRIALALDGDVLRRAFAIFLMFLAIRMWWSTRSPALDGHVDDAGGEETSPRLA